MSNAIVQRRLQIVIDESGADAALKKLTASADKLQKEIDAGTRAGRDMSEQIQKLSSTKSRMEELGNVLSGKMAPSFRQAQAAVSNLRKELERMSTDNPRYAATFDRFKQANQVFDEMKTKVTGFRAAANSVFSQIKSVALGVTVGNTITAITESITGMISSAITGAAKLSDEIANIQKVTGLAKHEVESLNSQLGKIDTRTGTSQLRELAVALGQAGEAVSIENIKALDQIVVALGDEFGGNAQEIGNVLQVLRNNLTDIKTNNFGDDVLHIANAMNELGAKGLATAPVVTDIANRIAGVAQTFGVSSGQILGVAASFQELGINTERGSTAYIKLLQRMATDTEAFAKVAGVSVQEFSTLVNTNINEALLLVAKNTQTAAGSNTAFAKILDELNAEGAGASEMLSKLAQNGDLVREKITLATDSLKSNSSILNEFGIKNETLGAQMDKLGKKMAAALNSSSLRSAAEGVIGWLNEMFESGDAANNEFERTKSQLDGVEAEISKLLPRYDELKGRTNLNAAEHQELRDIINQIVELVPSAADAFDQYGNAIDINKEKLADYSERNKQFLREMEVDAVESLTERSEFLEKWLVQQQQVLDRELAKGPGVFSDMAVKDIRQKMREMQTEMVSNVEILKNKYGVEIPESLKIAVTKIQEMRGDINRLFDQGGFQETKKDAGMLELLLPADTLTNTKKNATTVTNTASARRTGKSAAQLEAERRKKELEELAKELQKTEKELYINTLSPYEKSLAQIAQRYEQLFTKAGNNIEYRDKTLRLLLKETEQLNKEFEDAAMKSYSDAPREEMQAAQRKKELDQKEEFDRIEESLEQGRRDRMAGAELKFQQAMAALKTNASRTTREEALQAEIELITARRNAELNNAKLTANQRKQIELKADEEIKEARLKSQEAMLQDTVDKLQSYIAAYSAVSDVLAGFEGAKINRLERSMNKEQDMLDRQLKQKLISEQDYQIRSQNLEDKFQREKAKIAKREHKRQQVAGIASVLMNTADAAIKLWAKPGFPANIPLLALLALQTAGSIAKITASRPPEYATGGILPQGSSHAQGGIGLYDNRSGRHVGEIEGGEPIISRKVYKANKSIVDALLQKGWAQDSTPLPSWFTRPNQAINIARLSQSRGRTHFADGGFAPQSVADPAAAAGMQPPTTQNQMQTQVMMALLQRLNQPIYANVIYGEYEASGDAINTIRSSGMIS